MKKVNTFLYVLFHESDQSQGFINKVTYIFKRIEWVTLLENQIKDNIFLIDIKNTVFDDNTISLLEDLYEESIKLYEDALSFVERNPSFLEYSRPE